LEGGEEGSDLVPAVAVVVGVGDEVGEAGVDLEGDAPGEVEGVAGVLGVAGVGDRAAESAEEGEQFDGLVESDEAVGIDVGPAGLHVSRWCGRRRQRRRSRCR